MTDDPILFFDSHAHLDMLKQRGLNPDEIVKEAAEANVTRILAIVTTDGQGDFLPGVEQAASFNGVWCAAGVHPHGASGFSDVTATALRKILEHEKVVATGEIGLDYHYNHSSPSAQRKAFIAQLRIARAHGLPVVVHTRNADDDTVSILQDEGVNETGGVIHCFSSGEKLAGAVLELGMYLSFSGIVTFPKSGEIQDVAKWAPIDRILCETDSPFLSPAPNRGQTNVPARVRLVAEKIASLRGVPVSELAPVLVANTHRCLGIAL